jgi:hypothetical protein
MGERRIEWGEAFMCGIGFIQRHTAKSHPGMGLELAVACENSDAKFRFDSLLA